MNKVATAVQLRFDVERSALAEDVKERLKHLAGNRITSEGELLIEAKKFRTQEKNRQDALDRFIDLLQHSFRKPKARTTTKPTAASKEKRLREKKVRAGLKKMRQSKTFEQ